MSAVQYLAPLWASTVYVEFCIHYAECRRMDILVGIKAVTTNSHSDSVDLKNCSK